MSSNAYRVIAVLIGLFAASASARADVIDRIVAIVNDEIITQRDLEEKSYPILLGMPSQPTDEELAQIRKNVMIDLVKNKLVMQAARQKKIVLDREEVDMVVASRIGGLQKQYGAEFEGVLSEQGYSVDEFQDLMVRETKQEMIKSRLITQAVENAVIVTDDDIRTTYSTRMIMTRSPDDAFKVLLQLKSGKVPFEKAARQFSTVSMEEGGDMGTYLLGKWSEEIEVDVIKIKNIGEFSGVIQTPAGFAVIQMTDRRLKSIQDISIEERKKIRDRIIRLKSATESGAYVSSLWDRAYVKFLE